MPLSVVDLYSKILPKTNCKECGFPTCLAFASMVVSEKHPLKNCPYIPADVLRACQMELDAQYAAGKWTKRDLAHDALQWAKERAASMKIEDLPNRIGGELFYMDGEPALKLPYFSDYLIIKQNSIRKLNGDELNRWEQVFVYNHIAQGGSSDPIGNWKGLEQIPNTVSKIKSMRDHVEEPMNERFSGHIDKLKQAALALGGLDLSGKYESADIAIVLKPLPKIPLMLLFWDKDEKEDFTAKTKFLFDETITQHLDIESIIFLSERIKQLLFEHAAL